MSWFDRVRAGAVAGTVAGLLLSMNGGLTPAHAAGATVDWKGAISGLADDGYSLRSAAAHLDIHLRARFA